nr:hypothetical protein Iba_chr04fCG11960 [Ipomoea batatas]
MSREYCVNKCLCIEWLEVIYAFTNAYKLYGNTKLIYYTDLTTTSSRTIKFCQYETSYSNNLALLSCLWEHI